MLRCSMKSAFLETPSARNLLKILVFDMEIPPTSAVSSAQSTSMPPDIVVVGGGLGGLFTAALLSREGCRVTVLEKNTIAGGGLQSFRRGALQFDTGMHLLGGFRPGSNVWRLCRHLGVLEKLRLRHTDAQCMDEITLLDEQTTYRIAEGREGFVESWARYFPQARTELQNYVAAMYQLVERLDLFHLRAVESAFFEMPEEFLLTADAFIARYISDERLRELVAYMNPLYGGVKGRTPAYVHAVINVLYINGPSRFVGESRAMADALIEVVEAGGGKVVRGAEVQRIAVHDRVVTYVETTDGRRFSAERYICATHLREMLRLVDTEAFNKAYRTRLASLPVSYSAFCVFVELVPERVPYVNHTGYVMRRQGDMWDMAPEADEEWPHGFLYMTPPDGDSDRFARRLVLTAPMSATAVEAWADTRTGQRGADYEAWKRAHAERLLQALWRVHPEWAPHCRHIYSASPLTIRDYYHSPAGSMYGISADAHDFMRSQVPVVTKVRNLFLTGQCVGLHGICGTPLNAVKTAEAVLGTGTILRQL